jgi:hypothetical protein
MGGEETRYLGLTKKLVARDSLGIDSLLTRSLVNRAINEPARYAR